VRIEIYNSYDWILILKDGENVYSGHEKHLDEILKLFVPDAEIKSGYVDDEVCESGKWDGETRPKKEWLG